MHFEEDSAETLTAVVAIGKRPLNEIKILSWAEKLEGIRLEIIFIFDDFSEISLENEIRAKFESHQIKIKIFHVNFNSPGKSRQHGMRLVKSKWVVFWDCDDKPTNINYVVDILQKDRNEKNFYIFNYKTSSNSTGKSIENSKIRTLSRWSKSPGLWRVFFRFERILSTEFDNLKMGEDQVFLAKCNIQESETRFIELVAYEYFTGLSGQLTQDRNRVKEVSFALTSLENYFQSTGITKSNYQRQIEINLTKTALKIEFPVYSGKISQLKYLFSSRLVRNLLFRKFQYMLRVGS